MENQPLTTTPVETTPQEGHTLYAETLFHIGDFPVTNSMLTSWVAFLIIVVIGVTARKTMKTIPGKLQNIFEMLIEAFLDLCDQITNNREISEKAFPVAFGLFVFVLINNWLGILPGVGSIFVSTHEGLIPLIRGGTADLNSTLALAFFSVIFANLTGIFTVGVWNTVTRYIAIPELFRFKDVLKDPTLIIMIPINIFIGVLELIGEVAKIASLSLRLFGNVFAGEVLLAAMAGIFAVGVPLPFLFLEFFVGIIQAFIIATLTIVYVSMLSTAHGAHADDHEHAPAHA